MVYFGLGAVVAFGQKTLSSKAPEGYISNVSSNRPALQDKPGAEKTALLSVVYVDDYCCGYDPWYAGTNVTAMDDVFGAGNWSDETYSTVNPAELFSSNTCFIWLDGGADHDVAMQAFTQANKAAMEAWVAGGGILLFNSAGWDTPVGPVFGGVVLNWDYYYYSASYDAAITGGQGGHPIFNGPFLPVGSSWTGGYFSHDFVSGPYGTELISGTAGPILTEKTWGSGRVMFGGMTATYFHSLTSRLIICAKTYWPTWLRYATQDARMKMMTAFATKTTTAPTITTRDKRIPIMTIMATLATTVPTTRIKSHRVLADAAGPNQLLQACLAIGIRAVPVPVVQAPGLIIPVRRYLPAAHPIVTMSVRSIRMKSLTPVFKCAATAVLQLRLQIYPAMPGQAFLCGRALAPAPKKPT
ncbi:MAG: hypothetical protein IPN33_03070 [Saprospiraceae bacterium]|nr:hypothetical protein [Saprospiraceae bacterium]